MKPVFIHELIYQHLGSRNEALSIYHRADQKFWTGSTHVSHPRYGESKVWDMALDPCFDIRPNLREKVLDDFDTITNARAKEINQIMKRTRKRLAVFWSGGIDSSVVLAALVKNLDAGLLSKIDVCMTRYSALENPTMFRNVILKSNIQYQDIETWTCRQYRELFTSHLVTDGEPADKLWLVARALDLRAQYGADALSREIDNESEIMLKKFLGNYMRPDQVAQYWNFVKQNIQEAQAPVSTVGDWFWWINFNYHATGHLYQWYLRFDYHDPEIYDIYKNSYMPWYNTVSYHQWSYSQDTKAKVDFKDIQDYKMAAKQYIFNLTKDRFYLRHKTKCPSGRTGDKNPKNVLAIFEDGSAIYHEDKIQVEPFIKRYLLLDTSAS